MVTLEQILSVLDADTPFWIQDPDEEMWMERFENYVDAINSNFGEFKLNGKVLWMGVTHEDELVIEMKH